MAQAVNAILAIVVSPFLVDKMSLFRKPKRNFRQRTTKNDSDEENNGETDEEKSQGAGDSSLNTLVQESEGKSVDKRKVVNVSQAKAFKQISEKKIPVVPSASALSFEHEDEDEEGEVFKVKKSTYSRRIMKQLEKERKKKTKDKEGNFNKQPERSGIIGNDEPAKSNEQDQNNPMVINGEDMEEMELDSGEENEDKTVPDPFKKILESGSIPDAAMIHAARKRRQMAREMSEFITVDDTEPEKNNSRLIRDDDNDRSDDDDDEEHRGRISFSVTAPLAKDRAREALLAISQKEGDQGSDEEADEELERWEQEQIRKGVSIPQVPVTQEMMSYQYQQSSDINAATLYPSETYPQTSETIKRETQIIPSSSFPPPPEKSVTTLVSYKKQLKERLESRREVYRAHERERDRMQDDLVSHSNRILELEEKAPEVARAFAFYQEMRGYVTDLVECLDEKMVKINQLESSIFQLYKQRAQRLVQRSQQDVRDQAEEYSTMFGKQNAAMDSFNRDKAMDAVKARRVAEREGRRTRRRRVREANGSNVSHYDGMSSDDEEMEADIAHFNAEKERFVGEASQVFSDVVEDYHSINAIKRRFERWNDLYPESYKNAYIGLCIPKIFGAFIRLQLCSWNPFEESMEFEESEWFESLMFYGYQEGLSLDKLKDDSDSMLIPNVIERVILPKLTQLAEHVWNPVSTSQTLRFVNLMRKLMEYPTVNGKSKKTQNLLEAVVQRMRKTLDEDVYMPPYPKLVLENRSSGATTFFLRQYWSCVKLLRNLLSWQGIIDDSLLQEIALDGLLTRYLVWGLHNSPLNKDTIEKAKMVTATIPRSWFAKRESDNTIPQLEMFCRYLKSAADAIDKSVVNGSVADKLEAKENIKDIVKMLTNIGALNHAADVAAQFSIKDVKMKDSLWKE